MANIREFMPVREMDDGETEQNPQLNAKITVGAEAGNVITTTVQLYDLQETLAQKTLLEMWLSDTAGGVASAVDSESVSTGTEIQEIVNHGHYSILTDTNGAVVVAWTKTGATNRYLNVKNPATGLIHSSTVMAFTS